LTIAGKSFVLRGKGRLHDDPVVIEAEGTDNSGNQMPDKFQITAFERGHRVVFEAAGTVTSGDIQVGSDQ
jgi:hypothetical protein